MVHLQTAYIQIMHCMTLTNIDYNDEQKHILFLTLTKPFIVLNTCGTQDLNTSAAFYSITIG